MNEPDDGARAGVIAATNPWPGLAAAISAATIVGITYGGVVPLLSLNLEHLGVDPVWNGLMGAMPSAAMICLSAFIPLIVRRLGAARAVYASTALASVILLLFPVVTYVPAWFVLRFLMTLGIGLPWIVSETWINALAPAEKRGTVMGFYGTVLCVGISIGPLMISFLGSQGVLPFAVIAMVLLVAVFPIAIARRSGAPDLGQHPPMRLRQAYSQAPLVMLAALVNGAIWLAVFSLLPIYSLRSGLMQSQATILLTAYVFGNIGFQLPLGRLLDRWSLPLVLAICGVFQFMGAVALPFVVREGTVALLALAIWGGTLGGIYIAGLTLLGRSFTTAQLTGAASAQTLAFETGAILGPLSAGLGLHAWNPNGMLVVVCVAGTVLACLGLHMHIAARHSSSP